MQDENQPPAAIAGFSLVQAIVLGVELGVIGGAAVGLAEVLVSASSSFETFAEGFWPASLLLAAIGKLTLTHALVWSSILAVGAALHQMIAGGRSRSGPLPFVAALLVLLVGAIVLPSDLELLMNPGRPVLLLVAAASVPAAAGVYLALRWIVASRGLNPSRLVHAAALLSALLIAGAGMVLAGSPFRDPGGYRVPAAAAGTVRHARPHVLLIVLDTVRADRMSCHGYSAPTTPFLERFASQSILMDRASADGTWTKPSHASMFTGLSVRQHGVGWNTYRLEDDFTTTAEALSRHGYRTASFSNNPYLSGSSNLEQGFHFSESPYKLRRITRFSLEFLLERWGVPPPVSWLDPDYGAAVTNFLIARWLETEASRAPVFLFVNYLEAHLPWRVPRRYRQTFMNDAQVGRSYALRYRIHGDLVHALNYRFFAERGEFLEPADQVVLARQYDATIRYLDDRVAELVGMFEQRGLLDDTLVIITSDHGEYLGTHGMWSHYFRTYEDLTHVTLLVREPGRKDPIRITTPVQLSDIHPTVLNAALGPGSWKSRGDSRDLLELARRGGEVRIAISETGDAAAGGEIRSPEILRSDRYLARLAEPQIAAQDGRFKYIESRSGGRELYDLSADPGELDNLIVRHPGRARRLAAYVREWRSRVPAHRASPRAARKEDPDLIEELRSLGYLED